MKPIAGYLALTPAEYDTVQALAKLADEHGLFVLLRGLEDLLGADVTEQLRLAKHPWQVRLSTWPYPRIETSWADQLGPFAS